MTNTEISNMNDVIDSRDVIARIAELQFELEDAYTGESEQPATSFEDWIETTRGDDDHTMQDAAEEFHVLTALAEEASGYAADWQYGETLIRDSYFARYAEELAEDCGMVKEGTSWPNNCIDWEEAARQLKQDYTEVDYGGISYWIR